MVAAALLAACGEAPPSSVRSPVHECETRSVRLVGRGASVVRSREIVDAGAGVERMRLRLQAFGSGGWPMGLRLQIDGEGRSTYLLDAWAPEMRAGAGEGLWTPWIEGRRATLSLSTEGQPAELGPLGTYLAVTGIRTRTHAQAGHEAERSADQATLSPDLPLLLLPCTRRAAAGRGTGSRDAGSRVGQSFAVEGTPGERYELYVRAFEEDSGTPVVPRLALTVNGTPLGEGEAGAQPGATGIGEGDSGRFLELTYPAEGFPVLHLSSLPGRSDALTPTYHLQLRRARPPLTVQCAQARATRSPGLAGTAPDGTPEGLLPPRSLQAGETPRMPDLPRDAPAWVRRAAFTGEIGTRTSPEPRGAQPQGEIPQESPSPPADASRRQLHQALTVASAHLLARPEGGARIGRAVIRGALPGEGKALHCRLVAPGGPMVAAADGPERGVLITARDLENPDRAGAALARSLDGRSARPGEAPVSGRFTPGDYHDILHQLHDLIEIAPPP